MENKKHNILKASIDQHNQVKSHYTAISVKEAFQSYQHKQFNAEGGYAWLSENDGTNKETYEVRLNELTVDYSRTAKEYYACLAAASGANNEDTPGRAGNNKTKVRNDLKPKELKRDFTPMERRTWMRSFRHFSVRSTFAANSRLKSSVWG